MFRFRTLIGSGGWRTVELPDAAGMAELVRRDAGSIVLDDAVATAVVDGDVYFGGAGIEGVGEQAAGNGLEGGDGNGGLELVDDFAGELANGHGLTRISAVSSGSGRRPSGRQTVRCQWEA